MSSKSKIGITLNLPKTINELFTNGIRQNALFFSELLINIGKYEVCFIINNSSNITESLIKEIKNKFRFNYIDYSELINYKFDIIFSFGFIISKEYFKITSQKGTKNIYYNCGNSFIIDSESCLFTHANNKIAGYANYTFDECWNLPHMTNTNHHYLKTFLRCKIVEVPYVWSNVLVDSEQNKYVKRSNKKKIAIFEPNLSIMKWALPALLVCENAYRCEEFVDKIDKVYLTNITNSKVFNLDNLNQVVMSLNLKKDSKIHIEARYNSLYLMSTVTDIVVSHTWENWLNNLYFDIAWMGWPIIHNGKFCKEVGYYYEEFDYEMGGNVLKDAILNHHDNAEEYLIRNRLYIQKYLPTNVELQKQYEVLISNVLAC